MRRSDRDIVDALVARDEAAFEALYRRHSAYVRRVLLGIVRDAAAADDLLQEVFIRVWGRAGQWDGRGPLKAWVLRVATNLALNHLRSVRRRRERPLEEPIETQDEEYESQVPGWMVDTATLGPDAVVERMEQRRLLWQFVDDLPEEKREVIRMIHDAEMEIREVAERLEVPEGTVKSRLHHARRHLAGAWKKAQMAEEEV